MAIQRKQEFKPTRLSRKNSCSDEYPIVFETARRQRGHSHRRTRLFHLREKDKFEILTTSEGKDQQEQEGNMSDTSWCMVSTWILLCSLFPFTLVPNNTEDQKLRHYRLEVQEYRSFLFHLDSTISERSW